MGAAAVAGVGLPELCEPCSERPVVATWRDWREGGRGAGCLQCGGHRSWHIPAARVAPLGSEVLAPWAGWGGKGWVGSRAASPAAPSVLRVLCWGFLTRKEALRQVLLLSRMPRCSRAAWCYGPHRQCVLDPGVH